MSQQENVDEMATTPVNDDEMATTPVNDEMESDDARLRRVDYRQWFLGGGSETQTVDAMYKPVHDVQVDASKVFWRA